MAIVGISTSRVSGMTHCPTEKNKYVLAYLDDNTCGFMSKDMGNWWDIC